MVSKNRTVGALFRAWLVSLVLAGLATEALAQAANVVFATGDARIVATDGSARKAERGASVAAGDTIDTGSGRAQIRFLDGATMSLQPGTQFRVEQFRYSGTGADDDIVVMRFLKGALRTVSGLIGKQRREQYRMDTVVGTIGIRGTEYAAGLNEGGLQVTTYAGLVEVCNSAGCATAGPGQMLTVTSQEARPSQRPAGGGGQQSPGLNSGDAVPQLPPPQQVNEPVVSPPEKTVPQTPHYQGGRGY